ncbi:uncharacterized protein VTP21DRAFT_5539 [Calcarisporiella thermophila]|uniref:uncharacterized protein n=1 Tax=Calcarisporiella thermophila TaxID=911321 RepID=UPI0037421B7B
MFLARQFSSITKRAAMTHSKPKVFVTRIIPPGAQKLLEEQHNVHIEQWKDAKRIPREILLEKVRGVDGILCMLTDKIDKELCDAAGPQLKVISTMSVGYDHVCLQDLADRNIKLGYTPDVLTDATADITAMLALAAGRRMKESMQAIVSGEWGNWTPTWLLGLQFTGKTLGIFGLGRIGHAVGIRLRAFGIKKIIYCGPRPKPDLAAAIDAKYVSEDELLKESDVVCVTCSLNEKTSGYFNYERFKKMKREAIFVNTSRGGIVVQDDLERALRENIIFAAGLDVCTPEPLPPNSSLLSLPNCTLLPHIGSATLETRNEMGRVAVENVIAGVLDKELLHEVKL